MARIITFSALLLVGVFFLFHQYLGIKNGEADEKSSQPSATELSDKESNSPVEIGLVNWNRDLEKAKIESAKSKKPILVLFQEVPG